jgi:hypothetical protein
MDHKEASFAKIFSGKEAELKTTGKQILRLSESGRCPFHGPVPGETNAKNLPKKVCFFHRYTYICICNI